MFTVELALRIVFGGVLLLMNGFFVTTEFALTRVRQFDQSDFEGHPGLERAWKMTDKLELYLSSCQVGITISSVALGVVAEPAVTALFGTVFVSVGIAETAHTVVSIVIAMAVINLAHVIIGEQVPTYLGVERSQFVAQYCAPILYLWMRLMYPVVILSDMTSKAILRVFGVEITRSWAEEEEGPSNISELREEMGVLMSGGPLSDERQEEVLRALEISQIPIKDVMVPKDELIFASTEDTVEESLDTIKDHPHTRYPLYDPETDEIIGLIYSAAVLRNLDELQDGDKTLKDIATTLPILPPSMPVSQAIDHFQESKQELALVSEQTQGGTAPIKRDLVDGLITSTDTVEQITGELEDPFDEETNSN